MAPALLDNEHVFKVVRNREEISLLFDESKWELDVGAIRKEDVKNAYRDRNTRDPAKSVSLMRHAHTLPQQLEHRAKVLNNEAAWQNDPVVARALVSELRAIALPRNPKCVCVYADPIMDEDNDPAGPYAGHASLTMFCDLTLEQKGMTPAEKQAATWIRLREAIAKAFVYISHLSGHVVTD